jgi:N-acetylglutamate synthase-like GNAT family acetyltransferase
MPLGRCSAIECRPSPLIAIAKRGTNRTVVASSPPSALPSQPRLRFRRGLPEDSGLFFRAILSEKMNPLNINPARFLVAEEEGEEEEEVGEREGREIGGGEGEEEGKHQRRKKKVVAFGQLAELEPGRLFELRSLVTAPERRGRGIGAEIVRGLLEEAAASAKKEKDKEESATTAADVVLTTISRRRAFYERSGFEEVPSSNIPRQLRLEVAVGSVVARLAVGDSLIVLRKKV